MNRELTEILKKHTKEEWKTSPNRNELLIKGVPEDMIDCVEKALGIKEGYPFQTEEYVVLEGYLTEDNPPIILWRYLTDGDDDLYDPVFGNITNWFYKLFSTSKIIKVRCA